MILVMDRLTGQSISVNRLQLTENCVSIRKILNNETNNFGKLES